MIQYLVAASNPNTLSSYLRHWKPPGPPDIRVRTYESLERDRSFSVGTYIFSSLDLLTPAQRQTATHLWDSLSESSTETRLLNHPRQTMGRLELLTALYERGINDFTADRLVDIDVPRSFPVFIRLENSHRGALSPLLKDRKEFERAAARAVAHCLVAAYPIEDILVISFIDTADKYGIYRKYSAFIIGDDVLPRHVLFGRDWLLKVETVKRGRDLGLPKFTDEERDYIATNPHKDWILDIAKWSHVDYGRIDYSLSNSDRPQVWEINVNPTVCSPPRTYETRHLEAQKRFVHAYTRAMEGLERVRGNEPARNIAMQWPRERFRSARRMARAFSFRAPRATAILETVLEKPSYKLLEKRREARAS